MSDGLLLINAATALFVMAPQPVMMISAGSVGPAGPDITLTSNGIVARTAAGTYAGRTLVAPTAGFSITNPDGVGGNPVFMLSNDLAALESIVGTGYAKRTGADTWTTSIPTPGEIGAEVAGAAVTAIAAHVALADPHTQYRLESVSVPWSEISGTPTTIAGYGITDAYTKAQSDSLYSVLAHTHLFSSLTGKPTTIAGYGITDAFTQTAADALYSVLAHTHSFASLTGKPTTLAGYGIVDAQPSNYLLDGISVIGFGTRGFLVRTGVSSFDTREIEGTLNIINVTRGDGVAGNPIINMSPLWQGQGSINTVGTIVSGVWNGTLISTLFTDAKLKTLTGTANRISVGGTATDPTVNIDAAYVGQATITTLGTITAGTWNAGTVTSSSFIAATTEFRAPLVTSNAASALNLGTSGGTQLRVAHIASSVDFWQAEGSAAGVPAFRAVGTSANISPQFASKGAGDLDFITAGGGSVRFFTNGGSLQASVVHTASATRFFLMTGSNGGNPRISASSGNLDIASPLVLTAQTTASTVGAAGGASALPATPLGYLTTSINGTACKVPYYNT